MLKHRQRSNWTLLLLIFLLMCFAGCGQGGSAEQAGAVVETARVTAGQWLGPQSARTTLAPVPGAGTTSLTALMIGEDSSEDEEEGAANSGGDQSGQGSASVNAGELSLSTDFRDSFVHGDKGAAYQKYIVLHDTEGDGSASTVIDYWDSNGAGVAAHFVVNKDGSVVQCVPLDKITHHAGYGDTGHNAAYGVTDESRDDKVGTVSIGSDFADYGMNSYSVGIELVHVGGSGYYPEEQLIALDKLIAYIDNYYGFQSTIIDHKMWRSGNSDTSPEFSQYLSNYQDHRTHY